MEFQERYTKVKAERDEIHRRYDDANAELALIHKRLCEREIVTGGNIGSPTLSQSHILFLDTGQLDTRQLTTEGTKPR